MENNENKLKFRLLKNIKKKSILNLKIKKYSTHSIF